LKIKWNTEQWILCNLQVWDALALSLRCPVKILMLPMYDDSQGDERITEKLKS
jgi:hypothetical protein